jgi:hypothetical protein
MLTKTGQIKVFKNKQSELEEIRKEGGLQEEYTIDDLVEDINKKEKEEEFKEE